MHQKRNPYLRKAAKEKVSQSSNLYALTIIRKDILPMYVGARLIIISLTCKTICITTRLELVDLMVIVKHATSLGIDLLSADQL